MFLPYFFHLFAPRNVGQFRLAVRGHSLLVLDDSGSRIALTEAELLGLEIIAKAGSEGIPPMIGLKVVQPQDRDGMGWMFGEFGDDLGLVVMMAMGLQGWFVFPDSSSGSGTTKVLLMRLPNVGETL